MDFTSCSHYYSAKYISKYCETVPYQKLTLTYIYLMPGAYPGDSNCEGAVLEAGNNIKRSSPRFWSVFNQIESVIVSKFRWSPKKKVFTKIESVFLSKFRWFPPKKKRKPSFSGRYHITSLTNSHHQSQWGAIFVFSAKIGLKSAKTGYFAYSSGQ